MYKKIEGLEKLKKLGLPCPPHVIVSIEKDNLLDVKTYILSRVKQIGIPHSKGDRIGVTIRVSLPGALDKTAVHGGLHVTEEEEIVKRILQKYEEYKQKAKIIIMHTIDARCSGVIELQDQQVIIETIPGDNPPLLEGRTNNIERWQWLFFLNRDPRVPISSYMDTNNQERRLLSFSDINIFKKYLRYFSDRKWVYLEWSIAKNGNLYFYEYLEH
ncbi:hypothetical protein KAW65_00185 [candidate division WOR-3 bacterium]|nr:hypothetical protein [candidate division WOR-3 bacterium]